MRATVRCVNKLARRTGIVVDDQLIALAGGCVPASIVRRLRIFRASNDAGTFTVKLGKVSTGGAPPMCRLSVPVPPKNLGVERAGGERVDFIRSAAAINRNHFDRRQRRRAPRTREQRVRENQHITPPGVPTSVNRSTPAPPVNTIAPLSR